ncbi:MAG: hypothetical protein JRI25_18990, partial [Deltaproteobacteria bacterium]|nr:hypothetical protein [Deltaproteobacteria bacterium]
MALLAVFIGADATINQLVVGSPASPYQQAHSVGFTLSRFLVVAYTIFLDGMPVYRSTDPVILERMPWILLALPGMIYAVRTRGWRVAVALGVIALSLLFYTAYWNMSPVGLYEYALIHYFTWAFPLIGLFSYLTVRHAIWKLAPRVVLPTLLLPVALAWCIRLVETEPSWATVDDAGRLTVQDAIPPHGYDLIVIRSLSAHASAWIERDGRPLGRGVDTHYRRTVWRTTDLEGYVVHVARPFQPSEIRLLDKRLAGKKVELRKLHWRLVPVPPMVMKRLTGNRFWGVDSLHETVRTPASDLQTDVGRLDPATGVLHTTGRDGILAAGPLIIPTPGKYLVRWFGSVETTGKVIMEAWVNDGSRRIRHDRILVHPQRAKYVRPVAELTVKIREAFDDLEFRIRVDEEASLTLHEVEVQPAPR